MKSPRINSLLDGIPVNSDQGHVAFGSVTLIEGDDPTGSVKRVLVDTAHVGRRTMIIDELFKRGLTPLDIDYVVGTHAHWDHIQNVDLFTNARLLMHRNERRYAHRPLADDWATPSWTGFVIEQLQIEEVGDGHQIIPGVQIMEMFGHSVGSIGVLVDSEDGRVAVTSDALHFAWVAHAKRNPLVFWNERAAEQTIERVLQAADIVYPGHDMPFRIGPDGTTEYLKTFVIRMSGIDPLIEPINTRINLMPGRDYDCDHDLRWSDDETSRRIHEIVQRRYAQGETPLPLNQWQIRPGTDSDTRGIR